MRFFTKLRLSLYRAILAIIVAQLPAAYVYALGISENSHNAYYQDINGDGKSDLLLTSSSDEPSFQLLAGSSGFEDPKILNDANPANTSEVQFALYDLDLNGDGINDVFIHSHQSNVLSLSITNDVTGTEPRIVQTFANLGSDTTEISIVDENLDGKDDVRYTTSEGTQFLYGDESGHLQREITSQVVTTFGYDYENKRRYKVVEPSNGEPSITQYIDDLTEIRDGEVLKYVKVGGQRVARSSQTGGEFIAQSYYLTNHLGSTTLSIADDGKVTSATMYAPYGVSESLGDTQASPYKFTGQELDTETKLTYMHHRYLDTDQARFITPDPVFALEERFTDPQQWTPYAYARNNPVAYTDPNGLSPDHLLISDPSAYHEVRARGFGLDPWTKEGSEETAKRVAAEAELQMALIPGGAMPKLIKGVPSLWSKLKNALFSSKVTNSKATQLANNKAAGDAFESQVMGQLQKTQSGVVQQVTVKTQSGTRTRIDLMGRDANGNIVCTECKASATAPLTKNQRIAFPEMQQTGGVVVGKGKPGFPGGTQIPPTKVNIVRP